MQQMQLISTLDKLIKGIEKENNDIANNINEYGKVVRNLQKSVAQYMLPILVSPYLTLHSKKDIYQKFNEKTKLSLLNILAEILTKTKLDNEQAFALLFDFLLVNIYDTKTIGIVSGLSEEVKETVLKCFKALFTSMSWDLFLVIYTEKHTPKICLLLHMCVDMARKEKSRTIRLSAIDCIMKTAKVDDDSDLDDVVLLSQIRDILIKFLPGIASCLIVICTDDDKCGYQIITQCINAWGRLVSILMRDYDLFEDNRPTLETLLTQENSSNKNISVKNTHDEKLSLCTELLIKLTAYDNVTVRNQLADTCKLLVQTCFMTLPHTIPNIIKLLIILSQDEHIPTCKAANETLDSAVSRIIEDNYKIKTMVDNLQQGFFKHLTEMPRIFNILDNRQQITTMDLLNGYLSLFGNCLKLKNVLFTHTSLSRLMGSLLFVAEIERSNVSLLEEYSLHDWETSSDNRAPWKIFKFDNTLIQQKLETTCHLLVQPIIVDIVLSYLWEVFHGDGDHKSEATLLINEIIAEKSELIDASKRKELIYTYLDPKHWDLKLTVEGKTVLKDVQNNIIQLCMQLEGIGKVALAIGAKFHDSVLKVLYHVLEKAGSGHPLLRAAGLTCIANISKACGYKTITNLINANADYFAYHVTNKLRRHEHNASVLTVLEVVMNYSNMEVLQSISDIVEGVLLQSCDKFQDKNATAYLKVFAVFIKSMHKWLNVKITIDPVHTKQQKEQELEELRHQRWEELNKPVDLSDQVMGKTAEELYHEDVQKKRNEVEQDDEEPEISEYKKPEPPRHIKLITSILERSLNFLPSKDPHRKILVLEILNLGVEILRDHEDELLPIVHKIWSPLVNRFREFQTPLIINLSFNLLVTLGRLSKDFIRMRTIKEVLPLICEVLVKQSKQSFLKDRGSAYRYTQDYKMQVNILSGISRLLYDLDIDDDKIGVVSSGIELYLCNKQPMLLQEAALNFYKNLHVYDPVLGKKEINEVSDKYQRHSDWNKNLNILLSIT